MDRLTFKKNDDKFGVIGLNDSNIDEKIFKCIEKLFILENIMEKYKIYNFIELEYKLDYDGE